MSTQNATLAASWVKIADSADDPILIQVADAGALAEIAAMATETAPTVRGHPLVGPSQAVSRSIIGYGHLYARLVAANGASSITLIVSGSSETLS